MPASRGTRRCAAIKRKMNTARAQEAAAVELKDVDAAVAKLRTRAQAGERLSSRQLALLNRHGGIRPQSFD